MYTSVSQSAPNILLFKDGNVVYKHIKLASKGTNRFQYQQYVGLSIVYVSHGIKCLSLPQYTNLTTDSSISTVNVISHQPKGPSNNRTNQTIEWIYCEQ